MTPSTEAQNDHAMSSNGARPALSMSCLITRFASKEALGTSAIMVLVRIRSHSDDSSQNRGAENHHVTMFDPVEVSAMGV